MIANVVYSIPVLIKNIQKRSIFCLEEAKSKPTELQIRKISENIYNVFVIKSVEIFELNLLQDSSDYGNTDNFILT